MQSQNETLKHKHAFFEGSSIKIVSVEGFTLSFYKNTCCRNQKWFFYGTYLFKSVETADVKQVIIFLQMISSSDVAATPEEQQIIHMHAWAMHAPYTTLISI